MVGQKWQKQQTYKKRLVTVKANKSSSSRSTSSENGAKKSTTKKIAEELGMRNHGLREQRKTSTILPLL
jgi:hypothetical protein